MNENLLWIIVAFVAYMLMMIIIGACYMKKTSNSEDYFLGGRGLSGWVAALSAQASDMSGWLLMGLPGTVYALGTGQAWIAIGLFLGAATGIYSLLVGFFLSLVVIIIVSLCTRAPGEEILQEFADVADKNKLY